MLEDEIKILATRITDQDISIVKMLSNGEKIGDIAPKLGINKRTLEAKVARLRGSFNCRNSTSLVTFFLKNKLIDV